jgi:nucleotide-binding universal stress UspA family protein
MKGYKKILVPLDGSETSEAILPEIEKLASAFGATICILHVVPTPFFPGSMEPIVQYETITEAFTKGGEAYLRKIEKRLKEKGFTVEGLLQHGNEAQRILEQCDHVDIDLIAMSTHGEAGCAAGCWGAWQKRSSAMQPSLSCWSALFKNRGHPLRQRKGSLPGGPFYAYQASNHRR